MKLAFCLFKYYPYGGLERDFIRIISACQQHSHTIEVFTMRWSGPIPDKVKVNVIPVRGITNHGKCANFVDAVTKILTSQHYDAVVGFNRMPGLDVYYAADICYAVFAKKKARWWYRLTPRYRTYSNLEQAVFSQSSSTQIMYLAPMVKEQYISYYHTPDNRFHQLSPGISPERIPPSNAEGIRLKTRNIYNLGTNDKLLLQVGSDYKRKGVDRSLFALAALPKKMRQHVYLMIVGSGKTHKYKLLAQRLGILDHVKFLGASDKVSELLLAADILLHPARFEAAGMVLVEAIVNGLPVLATAGCGFAYHVVKANAGTVVPEPYEQEILNQSLRLMLTNEDQLKLWHQNGLNYGKQEDLYTREDAVKVIENI